MARQARPHSAASVCSTTGTRLLSREASWLVLDMLSAHPRPDGGRPPARAWFTAWKTGTSWGFRDAWTAGVVGPYVLVVWLGNFDGRGNPALVGIDAAAPLWQAIADALPLASNEREPPRALPPGLKQVDICSASGDLPNAWCPKTERAWFIPGRSPIRVSDLHRPVPVDRHGAAACPPYGADVREEIFEYWPSDLAQMFRAAGLPRRPPPAANDCRQALTIAAGEPPRWLSPLAGLRYVLRASRPEQSLALNAAIGADAKALYWFAGTALLGQSKPGQALPWRPPQAGRYRLTASDDRGRSTSREIEVEWLP